MSDHIVCYDPSGLYQSVLINTFLASMHNYKDLSLKYGNKHDKVYTGFKVSDNQKYVLKLVANKHKNTSYLSDEIHRQIKIHRELNHPNIVSVEETFQHQEQTKNYICIVMEYCSGGDLAAQIGQPSLTFLDRIELMQQLAQAVGYLHQRKILHRDIKPQNVFISRGRAKLGDFGLAKELRQEGSRMTQKVGTQYYKAPEIQDKSNNYSLPVDIWALGILFLELSIGQLLNCQGLSHITQSQDFPSPSLIKRIRNNTLRRLLRRMLARNYKERCSIEEVITKLQKVMSMEKSSCQTEKRSFQLSLAQQNQEDKGLFQEHQLYRLDPWVKKCTFKSYTIPAMLADHSHVNINIRYEDREQILKIRGDEWSRTYRYFQLPFEIRSQLKSIQQLVNIFRNKKNHIVLDSQGVITCQYYGRKESQPEQVDNVSIASSLISYQLSSLGDELFVAEDVEIEQGCSNQNHHFAINNININNQDLKEKHKPQQQPDITEKINLRHYHIQSDPFPTLKDPNPSPHLHSRQISSLRQGHPKQLEEKRSHQLKSQSKQSFPRQISKEPQKSYASVHAYREEAMKAIMLRFAQKQGISQRQFGSQGHSDTFPSQGSHQHQQMMSRGAQRAMPAQNGSFLQEKSSAQTVEEIVEQIKVLQLVSGPDRRILAEKTTKLGKAYLRRRQVDMAIKTYREAQQSYYQCMYANSDSCANNFYQLGLALVQKQSLSEAKQSFLKAEDIFLKISSLNFATRSQNYTQLGKLYLRQGLLNQAMDSFQWAVGIIRSQFGDIECYENRYKAEPITQIGHLQVIKKQYYKAIEMYTEAITIYKHYPNKGIIEPLRGIVNVCFMTNNFDQAITRLELLFEQDYADGSKSKNIISNDISLWVNNMLETPELVGVDLAGKMNSLLVRFVPQLGEIIDLLKIK